MKKIIDGKRYDTATAKMVAEWRSGLPIDDFRYYRESLYRTKRGNWFLAGEGNASSPYARSRGGERRDGEGIQPLSRGEAAEWLEIKDENDALEEHFSSAIEDA